MVLADKIFSFFGLYYKRNDSYPDAEGRGIMERFQRVLAGEYDEYTNIRIQEMTSRLVYPPRVEQKFIPLLEALYGVEVIIKDDPVFRRKLLLRISTLYKRLGSLESYRVLFRMAGFDTVEVIPLSRVLTLDSDLTFDDPVRRLDTTGSNFKGYRLNLTGSLPNDGRTSQIINQILTFVEPIYARARVIEYNGEEIVLGTLILVVELNGDLSSDNKNAPDTNAKLIDGDLVIDGENKNRYTVDENGDLLYDNN